MVTKQLQGLNEPIFRVLAPMTAQLLVAQLLVCWAKFAVAVAMSSYYIH
jgi:hypothetical protein